MIRRTITVDDALNTSINKLRGKLLAEKGVEIDFTTVINMFAEIGLYTFAELEGVSNNDIINHVVKKYAAYDALKIQAIGDMIQDLSLKIGKAPIP